MKKQHKNINSVKADRVSERSSNPGKHTHFRRLNITIREDQYEIVMKHGLSFSALIRDLLDDRFSSHKIVLNLSEDGKRLYDLIVGSFGVHDVDLEPLFLKVLEEFCGTRVEHLTKLRQEIKNRVS